MRSLRLALVAVALTTLFPVCAFAAESIDSMSSVITIRPDSSIRVSERIVYDFDTAQKHGIYRDIPLSYTTAGGKSGHLDLSDITVTDETGATYPFSLSFQNDSERIKIGDPNYTVTGVKTYSISYTAKNALAPYDTFDELYWNATGDEWQVPIKQNSATVILPAKVPVSEVQKSCYWGVRGAVNICGITVNGDDNGTVSLVFSGLPLNSGEGLTVAVGFPKGLVTYPPPVPWWQQYLFTLIALCALLLSILFALFIVWKDSELGRGTIVPEYEPPQGLKPAQADVLVHGKVSKRTWPATIVDLAVRGYIQISEDTPQSPYLLYFLSGILALVLAGVAYAFFVSGAHMSDLVTFVVILMFIIPITIVRVWGKTGLQTSSKDYILTRLQPAASQLETYEQKFLDLLFVSGPFSTRAMRKDRTSARALYVAMNLLESDLYKETASDTSAYTLDPDTARKRFKAFFGLLFFAVVVCFLLPESLSSNNFLAMLWQFHSDLIGAVGMLAVAAFIAAYPVYMRPRLNKEGSVEREQWLGFKLYLSKAEQYRLQNLTPETFEKFLPYAMVFGIEKKWAKAFASLNVPPPSWYQGNNATAFSAGAFASNFGSSFSSSFASTGAGGASGGGGSAGGGGGGGGGGSW